jgi:hypothetical protein
MKHSLLITSLLLSASLSEAQEPYDNGLFATEQSRPAIRSTAELAEYLRDQKPGTFRYYERLDNPGRKKVLDQLLADQAQDLTELVIQVYRQRGRN